MDFDPQSLTPTPLEVLALDRGDSVWNRAAAEQSPADAFCCRTEWQLSYHETSGIGRPLVIESDDDSVVAFAERRFAGYPPLYEPLENHWLFGCPLLGRTAPDLFERLLRIQRPGAAPPVWIVSGLRPTDPLLELLIARFGDRCGIHLATSESMRSASLAGGLDGYLSRRSGKWRRGVQQAARRLRERGVTFERHAPHTVTGAHALYDRVLAVEERSWKGIERCGMAEPPAREFYRVLLRRLAKSGIGRVILARDGEGQDIGFIFGGVAGPVYRGQQFSFDDEWRDASLGNVLQLEKLRWLTETGVQQYDMGPTMEYKLHWTEIETEVVALALRPGA